MKSNYIKKILNEAWLTNNFSNHLVKYLLRYNNVTF